jgi:hypothetical protein
MGLAKVRPTRRRGRAAWPTGTAGADSVSCSLEATVIGAILLKRFNIS